MQGESKPKTEKRERPPPPPGSGADASRSGSGTREVPVASVVEDDGKRGPSSTDMTSAGVQSSMKDMSRLLGAIKETLQSRDGQVQQTLSALPEFLAQVPRIHRAEIECLAQISKQLEHMGGGTRDVLARLDGLPDLLRTLALGQKEQQQFLDGLQGRLAETLEIQAGAIREGLDQSRKNSETQLQMIRSMATTQEDIFSTFQNTQNRALNVFHRSQQQVMTQHRETQKVLNKQVEMLVDRVHSAQTRIFWLGIACAVLAAGVVAAFLLT